MRHSVKSPTLAVSIGAVSAFVLLATVQARAAGFYVDPAAGAATGDGSQAKPWQTLQAVADGGHFGNEVKAGDTVWLRSGYHGNFSVKSGSYAPPITIAAAAGQTPTLAGASFSGTKGWVLDGASISPSYAASPKAGRRAHLDIVD